MRVTLEIKAEVDVRSIADVNDEYVNEDVWNALEAQGHRPASIESSVTAESPAQRAARTRESTTFSGSFEPLDTAESVQSDRKAN